MIGQSIIFPELTFTAPGIYKYTVKEHEPPDDWWEKDGREYRVVITVEDTGGGALAARVEYPDGRPRFVNKYYPPPPPPPPRDVCKLFYKLPFPNLYFTPPQKPEFDELMKKSPYVFDWWENMRKYFED